VTVAVTRHQPFVGSISANSIVVFGIVTFARLSHEHTGLASGKIGLAGASAACVEAIAPKIQVDRDIAPSKIRK
jgi:hypothetical protein